MLEYACVEGVIEHWRSHVLLEIGYGGYPIYAERIVPARLSTTAHLIIKLNRQDPRLSQRFFFHCYIFLEKKLLVKALFHLQRQSLAACCSLARYFQGLNLLLGVF